MPIMPAQTFRAFSQDDLDAIVEFLRSQEPVESVVEHKQGLSTLAIIMTAVGMLPLKDQPDSNVPPPAVEKGPAAAYGAYVVGYADGALCHGETFEGGKGGILPKGPSLRGIAGWQEADFVTALRTGVTPGGKNLDPDEMPWEAFGRFDDTSLRAVYQYLREL